MDRWEQAQISRQALEVKTSTFLDKAMSILDCLERMLGVDEQANTEQSIV